MLHVALAAHEREYLMELHFMAIAILILTLIAAFAIRRAEEEIIEHRELDRRARNDPSA